MKKYIIIVIVCLSQFCFIACKKDDKLTPRPLYERIGGEPVVTAIIDQSITNIITDVRINFFFAALATNPQRAGLLRKNLIDQLGELSGGKQTYTGRSMIVAHTGMNINEMQFSAFIEDFTNAIQSQNLPEKERNELIQLYLNLKNNIVGK